MFDLGIQELIVIFVVALLVVGPKKLPELGRTIGRGMAEIRKAFTSFKEHVNSDIEDVSKPLKDDYNMVKEKLLDGSAPLRGEFKGDYFKKDPPDVNKEDKGKVDG